MPQRAIRRSRPSHRSQVHRPVHWLLAGLLAASGASCFATRSAMPEGVRAEAPELPRPPRPLFEDDAAPAPRRPVQAVRTQEEALAILREGIAPQSPQETSLEPARSAQLAAKAKLPPRPPARVSPQTSGEVPAVPASAGPLQPVEVLPAAHREDPSGSQRSVSRAAPGSPAREGEEPLEALFRELQARRREVQGRKDPDDLEALERAEVEGKLIALLFLRRASLEESLDLVRSRSDDTRVVVELELLRAALYQRLGLTDLRDQALERVQGAARSREARFVVSRLALAREIRGYRQYTPRSAQELQPGEDLLLYGEMEGFRSSLAAGPAGQPLHRRSFSAELVLRSAAGGEEIDRRELLRAGQATETVTDPAQPVHFWGRFTLPRDAAPGEYRLEVEAVDLESRSAARASLAISIR